MNNRDMPISAIWNPDMNLGETAGCGLTQREYFAGLAMQGMIANTPSAHLGNYEHRVALAIEWTDELLKQLEK